MERLSFLVKVGFGLCLLSILILAIVFNYRLANGASFVCRFEPEPERSIFHNYISHAKPANDPGHIQNEQNLTTRTPTTMPTIKPPQTSRPTLQPSERPTPLTSKHPTALPSKPPTLMPSAKTRSSLFGFKSGFDRARLQVLAQPSCYEQLRDIAFVHIPKTGGETIELMLRIKKNHRYASVRKARDACWDSKFKFAVVRNPWDRMLSFYFHLRKSLDKTNRYYHHSMNPKRGWKLATTLPFNEWIARVLVQEPNVGKTSAETNLFSSAHQYLFSKDEELLVDYVIKFENFKQDIEHMLKMLGKTKLKPPKVNGSRRKRDYRVYYNKTSIDIVARVFALDVSLFNYTY